MKKLISFFGRSAGLRKVVILILLFQIPVTADTGRYIVTCNHHYLNKYNTLGIYGTVEQAKKRISRAKHPGQWYVYDKKAREIVWPVLDTDDKKIKKAVYWAKSVSKDPRHGYTCEGELTSSGCELKWNRWGRHGDYSCSTLIGTAYELFGYVSLRNICKKYRYKIPVNGRMQIGYSSKNMIDAIRKSGKFKDISASIGKKSLHAGDILITADKRHAAMMVSSTMLVEAMMNEQRQEYTQSTPGDQLGVEILMRPYYKFRYVFRPVRH